VTLGHFFSLLDADGTNEIDLEEFIIGCFRLKGNAKAMDMVLLGYESKRLSKQIQGMETQMLHCQQLMMRTNVEHDLVQESNTFYRDETLQGS